MRVKVNLKVSGPNGLTVGSTNIITGGSESGFGTGGLGGRRDVGGTVGLSGGSGYYPVNLNDYSLNII